jgi:hypothetical protein
LEGGKKGSRTVSAHVATATTTIVLTHVVALHITAAARLMLFVLIMVVGGQIHVHVTAAS